MGRPPKAGLDYYLCDVGWMTDSKFRRLKLKYGYLAPHLYQVILTLIYKDKGYYVDASCMEELCFDILEYLQGKFMPKMETVEEMVEDFTLCGLFSRELYETEHILTSRRIQKEYYNSTAKRSMVNVDKRYWLLSVKEMKSISSRSSILDLFVSDGNNGVSDGRNHVSDGRNPQRREDKNREEKMREDQIREEKNRGDKIRAEQIRAEQIREEQIREEGRAARGEEQTDGHRVLTGEATALCLLFQDEFSADPSEDFAWELERCLQEGMTGTEIRSSISKAARRNPNNPEAYVLGILRSAQRKKKPAELHPEAQPLADWELDWMRGIGLEIPQTAG